jgi:CDP-paratose 2-epimerase
VLRQAKHVQVRRNGSEWIETTNGNGAVGGAANLRVSTGHPNGRGDSKPVLITGGAGFIGTNLADNLLSEGRQVIILDSLTRPGVERHIEYLQRHGNLVEVEIADVRDASLVQKVVRHASSVFHFAAQVAVTTSIDDPVTDFDVNSRGTLNVLEAIRLSDHKPPLIFTSTNKVYGALENIELEKRNHRYQPVSRGPRESGIDERRKIDFQSPYGCSKGAADQYVLDYARTFGLAASVFRMSCIYGPHQCGNEDQGWIAHFVIKALDQKSVTIYGDGMQVRDVLYVEDLVRAFRLAMKNIDKLRGQVFNIGGGPENAVSLLQVLEMIGKNSGAAYEIEFSDWRTGDQRYYVSDTRRFEAATGWQRKIGYEEGIRKLYESLAAERRTLSVSARHKRGLSPEKELAGVSR